MQTWARLALAALMVIGAVVASTCSADAGTANSGQLDEPVMNWVKMPDGADIARNYPRSALGLGGKVLVRCAVTAKGVMADCRVIGEAPERRGFGDAALKLMKLFVLKAGPREHRPIEGIKLNIPLEFVTDGGVPPPVLDLNDGATAFLATDVTGSSPRQRGEYDCPSASGAIGRCQAHAIDWTRRPNFLDANAILAKSGLDHGASIMECRAGADGSLVGCKLDGATHRAETAAVEFSKAFKVPPKARDGVSTADGSILIEIDWARTQRIEAVLAAPAR